MRESTEYNGEMPGAPDRSLRVARRATARIGMAHLVRTGGRFLAFGAGAGVIAAAVGSFVWGPPVGLILAGCCLVAAAVAALVTERLRHRSPLAGATRIDEALGLKDRISSAVEFGEAQDPFVRFAIADAERVAAQADVRRAVPVRADRLWTVWPVLGAVAVGAALMMPLVPRNGRGAVDPAEVARTRESLSLAAAELQEQVEGFVEPEAAQQDAIDRMREIERELAAGLRTPEEAATEASAVVEDAAERLETQAQAERERALRERLDRIEPEEVGAAAALAEALREGDLAGATEALRDMARRSGAASEAERQALADDLRRLAAQLRPEADSADGAEDTGTPSGEDPAEPGQSGDPANRATDEPEPAGPPTDADQEPAPEESQDGTDSGDGTTRSDADRAAREQIERDSQEQTQRDAGNAAADELADRLDDMADQIENPEQTTPGGESGRTKPDGPQERQQPEPGARGEPQPGAADEQQPPSDNSREGANRGDQPRGERPAEPSPDSETGESGEAEGAKPGAEPTEGQPQNAEDAPEDSAPQSSGDGGAPEESKPGTNEGATPTGEESGEPSGESPSDGSGGAAPGSGAKQTPGEGAPEPGSIPRANENSTDPTGREAASPSGRASDDPNNTDAPSRPMDSVPGEGASEDGGDAGDPLDRAIEQIEKMDRQQRESLQRMAQSQKLRERARELLEGASPEQQRRLADLADRLRQETGPAVPPADWNPETELFDARAADGSDGTNRQVGSSEPTGPPEWDGRSSTANRTAQVREAAAAAEQAIEGQAIPRRYRDYVRNVYRRMEEQAAAVEEGRDADAPAVDKPGAGG